MRYTYTPKGVCSKQIIIDIENNIVNNVEFVGGCSGNLKAISTLVKGYTVEQVAEKLSGITCGTKKSSCSDQLAKAVLAAVGEAQQ